MFRAFVILILIQKQLDGFVGQQEDTVVPLGVTYPEPAHQSQQPVRLGRLLGDSVRMPALMKADAGQFYFSTLNNQVKLCDILHVNLISYDYVCVCMGASECVHTVCVSGAMC